MSDDMYDHGRRAYLTALVTAAGVSGCLGLEESEATPSGIRNGSSTPETGTDEDTSTLDGSGPESSEETLPPGTRWTFDANGPFVAGPVYADGTVIATSIDRNVYGIDGDSGEQRWAAATETALEAGLDVVDGTAVAAGIEEQLGVAVDDGTTSYQYVDFDKGVDLQTAGNGLVYQARIVTGGIRAVRPGTGEIAWSDRTAHRTDAEDPNERTDDMASDGETVCLAVDPNSQAGPPWGFAGYDAETGEQLWYIERDLDIDNVVPRVAVSDGICLADSGDSHHMILDARTGAVQRESRSSVGEIYGAVDGTVVFSDLDGFQGADIETLETRWDSTINPSQTTFDGATLWLTDDDDTVYRTDVPSGEVTEMQQLETGESSLTGDLAVTDETVFVTTEDATLRALERQ